MQMDLKDLNGICTSVLVFVQVVVGHFAFGARVLDVRTAVRVYILTRAGGGSSQGSGKLGGMVGCPGLVAP